MSIDLLTGLKLLGCRFLGQELCAVAGGGEDSDEHVGRHPWVFPFAMAVTLVRDEECCRGRVL